MRFSKAAAILTLTLLAGGCASARANPEELNSDMQAIEDATNQLLGEMSPQEREAFSRRAEESAMAEVQAAARQCGTTVRFTTEPRFEDRSLLIDRTATPDQIACVRARYSFARPQP